MTTGGPLSIRHDAGPHLRPAAGPSPETPRPGAVAGRVGRSIGEPGGPVPGGSGPFSAAPRVAARERARQGTQTTPIVLHRKRACQTGGQGAGGSVDGQAVATHHGADEPSGHRVGTGLGQHGPDGALVTTPEPPLDVAEDLRPASGRPPAPRREPPGSPGSSRPRTAPGPSGRRKPTAPRGPSGRSS